MAKIWPSSLPNEEYELDFVLKKTGSAAGAELALVKEKISYQLVACFVVSLAIGVWYFMTKVSFFSFFSKSNVKNFAAFTFSLSLFLALDCQQHIWPCVCRQRY